MNNQHKRYNPHTHNRRSIRLPGYDYRNAGGYYVTICVLDEGVNLATIEQGNVTLTEFGQVVDEEWRKTSTLRPYVSLDAYVIMPDHFHGILWIRNPPVGAQRAVPLPQTPTYRQFGKPMAHSLSVIIKSFKSSVTRNVNRIRNSPGDKFWQRNYYESIIRDEEQYYAIRQYILANPGKWTRGEHDDIE